MYNRYTKIKSCPECGHDLELLFHFYSCSYCTNKSPYTTAFIVVSKSVDFPVSQGLFKTRTDAELFYQEVTKTGTMVDYTILTVQTWKGVKWVDSDQDTIVFSSKDFIVEEEMPNKYRDYCAWLYK